MLELTDSHCHLFKMYFEDFDAVIARMKDAGVTMALVPGYDLATSKEAMELAGQIPGIYCAAGVHPTSDYGNASEAGIALNAVYEANPGRIAAVGETGIDLHWSSDRLADQIELFKIHLRIAKKFDKPVIIHTRNSASQVVEALESADFRGRGIFHCFDGSAETLEWGIRHGFGMSFAGNLTFPKAEGLRKLAAEVPAELLLVETDSPFIAPVPFRGKRNEPANVCHTLKVLADARGSTMEECAALVRANFMRILGI